MAITPAVVQSALRAAQDWEAKGNPNWACRNYVSATLSHLSLAVTNYPGPTEGVSYLREQAVAALARKCIDLNETLLSEIHKGALPAAVIGGSYHLLVLAHISWLLTEDVCAAALIKIANDAQVVSLSTGFWREYGRGIAFLRSKEPYLASGGPWKKAGEKYWAPYLDLIADLTHGRPTQDSLRAVEASFSSRNADKRFKDDAYRIEGSGLQPVQWDFRREAILSFSARA